MNRALQEFLETVVLGLVAAAIVGGLAFWYFGIYDTAKGKCQRGDLSACVVWRAEQEQGR